MAGFQNIRGKLWTPSVIHKRHECLIEFDIRFKTLSHHDPPKSTLNQSSIEFQTLHIESNLSIRFETPNPPYLDKV